MGWLGLILLAVGLIALFVLWDMIFCGRKRCQDVVDWISDRM